MIKGFDLSRRRRHAVLAAMPRLQFELPDDFAFSTELEVYFSHLNWANHLDKLRRGADVIPLAHRAA